MITDHPALKFGSIYDGEVVQRVDPERLGRIKARVVGVHAADVNIDDLPWCWPRTLGSVECGIVFVPPLGSWVEIEFKQGDHEYPVWRGGWWAKESKFGSPETANGTNRSAHTKHPTSWFGSQTAYGDGELLKLENLRGVLPEDAPNNFVFCSPMQKRLELDDRKNRHRIVLADACGNALYLNTEGAVWTLEAGNGARTSSDKPRGIVISSNVAEAIEQIQVYTFTDWRMTWDDVLKVWETSSPSGYSIRMDETRNRLEVWTAGGHRLVMDDEGKRVELSTSSGRKLWLDDTTKVCAMTGESAEYHVLFNELTKQVEVFSGGDIHLKAPNGRINISAGKTINVDSLESVHLNSGYYDVTNLLTEPAAYQKPERLALTPKAWESSYFADIEKA